MSIQKSDHQIIRDYITANDHMQYAFVPEGLVCVTMTHSNLPAEHPDIRLELHSTILEVKEKFRFHTGTPIDHQRLLLKDNGKVLCELNDNNKKLGYYSVISGMEIHIIDTDPFSLSRNGGLTDVSLIQKYTMAEEDYAKRKGTVREYIREQKKLNPNFNPLKTKVTTTQPKEIPGVDSVEGITVGSRCEVHPGARRGVVMFVGEIPNSNTGYWVGVKFDEPVGKGDGTAKGNKLFECEPMFGGFVRGKNVLVGDYPERDIFAELEEDNDNKDNKNDKDDDEDEI
mmetsp:Transcript_13400/g.12133  ORF Transcript_13400/g.12133 Transcript_13400/m.12133 type:complete len:285 (-) Transcript_13400:60-914(-)